MAAWQRVPDFDYVPEGGPVQIGNIIANPYKPHRWLTAIAPDSLERYPGISKSTSKLSMLRDAYKQAEINLSTDILNTVKLVVRAKLQNGQSLTLRMTKLTTVMFKDVPGKDLILERINESKVKAVMRPVGLSLRQPVYMIVGLKVAEGLHGIVTSGKDLSGMISAGGGLQGYANASVSAGAGQDTTREDTFEYAEDRIIGYTLLELTDPMLSKDTPRVTDFRPKRASLLSQEDTCSVDPDQEDVSEFGCRRLDAVELDNAVEFEIEPGQAIDQVNDE